MDINKCCNKFFFNTLLGIIPTDSCPPIIGEYNSIDEAPDGTVNYQLVVVRYIDGSDEQHIHLYHWVGAWEIVLDTSSIMEDGGFGNYHFTSGGGWEYSIDEGVTWETAEDHVFDPPVPSITVWFRNIDNGCVYTNLPMLPLVYCGTNLGIFADVSEFPVTDVVGDVAMISYLDGGSGFEYRDIYEWDGANYVQMVSLITQSPQIGSSPNPTVAYIDASWLVSYDEGATWGIDSYPNTPAVATLPIWYKNSNDCIYVNDPVN